MSAERVFLWVAGPLFLAIGAAYLVSPVAMAAVTELGVATATATIDVRGYYGGQLAGIGALVLLGAVRPAYAPAAFLVVASSLGGTGLGRLVGLAAADAAPPLMVSATILELASAVTALLLARRTFDLPAA